MTGLAGRLDYRHVNLEDKIQNLEEKFRKVHIRKTP